MNQEDKERHDWIIQALIKAAQDYAVGDIDAALAALPNIAASIEADKRLSEIRKAQAELRQIQQEVRDAG